MDEQVFNKLFANLTGYTHWVIAYSGGLDSSTLLHAAKGFLSSLDQNAYQAPELLAVHVDHQLSPNHSDWANHCKQVCAAKGIPFTLVKVDVDPKVASSEQAARDARYQAFSTITRSLNGQVALLLAHHGDDQTETLLLRLLRGTGVYGAAGMLRQRKHANADLHRPFLSLSKADLLAYARCQNVSWIEDESNDNEQFDRNFLRQSVTPLLASRWPQFAKNFLRFSALAMDAQQLNDDLAELDLLALKCDDQRFGLCWSRSLFAKLPVYRRINLCRYCLAHFCAIYPEREKMEKLDDWLIAPSSTGQFVFRECRFRVYRDAIYFVVDDWLTKVSMLDKGLLLEWAGSDANAKDNRDAYALPTGNFQATSSKRGLQKGCYRLRSGVEYDKHAKLCLHGINKTVHKVMQELGVPSWMRESYPLLYRDGKLAAVPPLVDDEFFEPNGLTITWKFLPVEAKAR